MGSLGIDLEDVICVVRNRYFLAIIVTDIIMFGGLYDVYLYLLTRYICAGDQDIGGNREFSNFLARTSKVEVIFGLVRTHYSDVVPSTMKTCMLDVSRTG